jgi:hypothetical protein
VDSVWKAINSPFAIFVLSSVLVVAVTRYLDARNARRVEAREQHRYVVECKHRIGYTLAAWPDGEKMLIWQVWNINGALDAGSGETYYKPLFKDLAEQSFDGLLTLLETGDRQNRLGYATVRQSIEAWGDLSDPTRSGNKLVEDDTADKDLTAQLRTFVKIPTAGIESLKALREQLTEDYQFLESVRSQFEKILR